MPLIYSILPILVSSMFLAGGVYVLCAKGFTRTGCSFFALCVTSAFWQGTWAVLFQIRDPHIATYLIKLGYLFILFLPTSLYHFLAEISEVIEERRYVYISYGIAATLSIFLIGTDLFISGYYKYFWGFYPRAGILHPLHVLQTIVVVNRGLYITFRRQQIASSSKQVQLRLCIAAIFIYFFAAIDYVCNYGIEFYPPGVAFLTASLGIIAIAIFRHDLFNQMIVAASIAETIAHEIRTPLASICMLANGLNQFLPNLFEGYQLAIKSKLFKPSSRPFVIKQLSSLATSIAHEVNCINTVLDMMLASVKMDRIDTSSFQRYSISSCIIEALDRFPFDPKMRERVTAFPIEDFQFYGSNTLLILVLFNLMKNSIYALNTAGKGKIYISTTCTPTVNSLHFADTGIGISEENLRHVFDAFFTTKKNGGSGIGLAFCRRVMNSFGGQIRCDSVIGQYTTFILEFPVMLGQNDTGAQTSQHFEKKMACDTSLHAA